MTESVPVPQSVPVEMDRKDLKIEAMRQRLAQIVTEYEDRDADRRVAIHELSEELQQAYNKIATLEAQDAPVSEGTAPSDEAN